MTAWECSLATNSDASNEDLDWCVLLVDRSVKRLFKSHSEEKTGRLIPI